MSIFMTMVVVRRICEDRDETVFFKHFSDFPGFC